MEAALSLQNNLYPKITPAGAYYAVSANTPSASRALLCGLLRADTVEPINHEQLLMWAETNDIHTALNLLYRLQRLEFVYGDENSDDINLKISDEQLPELLKSLSSAKKALLADEKGLYITVMVVNRSRKF